MKSISRRKMGSQVNERHQEVHTRVLVADAHLVEARSVADRQPEDCRRKFRLHPEIPVSPYLSPYF
jgi:hypothetical protein